MATAPKKRPAKSKAKGKAKRRPTAAPPLFLEASPEQELLFNLRVLVRLLRDADERVREGAVAHLARAIEAYAAYEISLEQAFGMRPKRRGRRPEPAAIAARWKALELAEEGVPTQQGRRVQKGIAERISRSARTVERYTRKVRQ